VKYIFIIGTEHQLRVVEYAINHFILPAEDIILVVQIIMSDYSFYEKVKEKNEFGLVVTFENWTFKDLLKSPNTPNFFINLCKELKHKSQEVTLFTSQYSDDSSILFIKYLEPRKIYVLDEGSSIFLVLTWRRGLGRMKFFLTLIIKSLFYKTYLNEPESIIFFTQFYVRVGKRDRIQNYVIPIKDNKLDFNTEIIGFLGSSIVELNIVSEADYLYYLNLVTIRNSNKKLLYYSHRKENLCKLHKIEALGFEIKSNNVPFEIYFANQNTLPYKLISFHTTIVLFNISKIFKNIPILEIYDFPLNKIKKFREITKNIRSVFLLNDKLNIINISN
jgi:hypothetical protein